MTDDERTGLDRNSLMRLTLSKRPLLYDVFCGDGGATKGYQMAGFRVIGIDHTPQSHYCGDAFIQMDAMEFLDFYQQGVFEEASVIHCSPPCQAYSRLKGLTTRVHPQLIDPIRARLQASGIPWVIENVVGAPLSTTLLLCGSMFRLQTSCGAQLRRHRIFESSELLMSPGPCQHGEKTIVVNGHECRNEAQRWSQRRTISVAGSHARDSSIERYKYRVITVTGSTPQQNTIRNELREVFSVAEARLAMGIDWMPMRSLAQAVPPAYTKFIGTQLRNAPDDR